MMQLNPKSAQILPGFARLSARIFRVGAFLAIAAALLFIQTPLHAQTSSGTLTGVRYSTDKRSILQAAYEGLVATLLEAIAFLDQWAPQRADAPLLLLGGGARGAAWQQTVRRLSGRPVLVVEMSELVAYGAAIQACAAITGEPLGTVATRWDARRGLLLEPVPRDDEVLEKVAAWRRFVLALLESGPPA